MVDHIDVLTGAQSSLYGSSAITGVINIVLKDKVDGTTITARAGGYSQGGGRNGRMQLVSGFSWDKLDVIYGLEVTHQNEMLERQAPGLALNKPGTDNPRAFLILDETGGGAAYVDPGADACAPLHNLYNNTLVYSHRSSGSRFYCGSPETGFQSILNRDTAADAMMSAKYHVSDNMVAYADLLYNFSEPSYSGGLPFWASNRINDPIFDQTTGRYEYLQRIFAPEEIGGFDGENQHVYTHAFNATLGLKGNVGNSDFSYDVYYNRSQVTTDYKSHTGNYINHLIDNYYLGPQLGIDNSLGVPIPIFAPNLTRLYTALTPAQYDSFIGFRSEHSLSWTENFTSILNNTALFALPAGDVGGAVIAQYGIDQLNNPPDPNAVNGAFGDSFVRPTAAGSRSHYALGTEFRAPVTSMLTADASGRYDRYDYSAGSGYGGGSNGAGKFTYKVGLEFRPLDDLLFRTSYATAFRTPDLFNLFQGKTGSFGQLTDWYQCRVAGFTTSNIGDCPLGNQSPLTITSGSTTLKNITAKSFSYGFVWSPFDNRLNLSVDFNRVNIKNEVAQIDLNGVLMTEANCRIGHSENGVPFDINSPTCRNAIALVQRLPPTDPFNPNGINQVTSIPTNIAQEYQSGLQASARYNWKTDRVGNFGIGADYFVQLKHTSKAFPDDVTFDDLCCGRSFEFYNTFSAHATWDINRFNSTLRVTRDPPTWRADGSTRNVPAWIIWNGSVKYAITPDMSVQLIVNNITNKQPPKDPSNGSYPYFDFTFYNPYGRAYWLEFGIKFGGSKS
jgi:outer membrane receptor protein involved in Fe transport